MNQIEQMFALQKQLNDETNGEIWITGVTKENRKISWYRGIYMEVAEAIDSFNWKHWKNINDQPDWDNIKVEFVDIWHFIMSDSIRIDDHAYANKHLEITAKGGFDSNILVSLLENMLQLAVTSNINPEISNIRQITDLFLKLFLILVLMLKIYISDMLSRIN